VLRKSKLAYISTASHSGSTLLAFLLGSHPKMYTVGELKLGKIEDRENYLCSCRVPLIRCSFWNEIGQAMRARGLEFVPDNSEMDFRSGATSYVARLLRPLYHGGPLEILRDQLLQLSPQWRARYPIVQRRNAALIESVLELTGSDVIVDSSKTGVRLKYLLRNESLDVRVIRLIRDGRAVALAHMEPGQFADAVDPALRGGGTGNSRSHVMSMQQAATLWKRSNLEGDALVARLPSSAYMQVRYEDICRSPGQSLSRICDFLGVDRVDTSREFRRKEFHVVGNGMRLDTRSEVVLDDRWRRALSPSDLKVFANVAGDLNSKYGYD
jgi:hypothetical protein